MKLTKGDKILVVFLIIFSILLAFYMSTLNKNVETKYVSIQVNGNEINTIEFTKDNIGEKYKIETEYGYNILEIGDGEIKIIDASCLDKLCIKQGTISEVGQLLVCLPNRLIIEIKSDNNTNNQIDGQTF